MRKLNSVIAGLAATLAFAYAPCADAQQPPPKIVQVSEVIRADIAPTVSVPGTVFSRNDVQITAGIGGQLEMVAEPGTIVEKGDIVARVDRQTLLLQRAEQEALLERAEINLRQLESDLRRQRELQGSNLVSEFQLEQTEANRDLARSDVTITSVRIRQIDDQIRRSEVRAQFTGVVVERLRRGGEDVSRGEVLGRMTDTRNMEVRAFVPLKHLARTSAGDAIDVFDGGVRRQGTIRALIPTGDVRSQTFEARIDLPDPAQQTWPIGQLVSVAVPIRSGKSTLTVPRDALILRQNGQFVYRISDDNKAERIFVEIGDSDGELIAVSGALKEGDSVAIRGAESLSEGADVQIVLSASASVDDGIDET